MHRILPTNDYLTKIKLKNDSSCTFCRNKTETLQHLFLECTYTKILWNEFETYISSRIQEPIQLTLPDKLFGSRRFSSALNHLLLLAKRHIYYSRNKNLKPCMQDLLQYINQTIKLEKYIAIVRRNTDNFQRKWSYFT